MEETLKMKKKSAIIISAMITFNALGNFTSFPSTTVSNNDYSKKSIYPNSQMIVKPEIFMKNKNNWDGPNVIEDDNLRFMINSRYNRKGTDEQLKKLAVTKEMVKNLRILSPEQ